MPTTAATPTAPETAASGARSRSAAAALALGLAAAVLSPALQLATASPLPYLLVLPALGGLAWLAKRPGRVAMGFTAGAWRHHALAAAYPIAVMAVLTLAAAATGNIDTTDLEPGAVLQGIALMATATWVGVLITEEGFYRGVLWGVASDAGWSPIARLAWTSVAFALWHLAVPFVDPGYAVPMAWMPAWVINVVLLGLTWGLVRHLTGSVLVACTAHAVWNGLAYTLFGYGENSGDLAIAATGLFGPERGWLGVVINGAVFALLLRHAHRSGALRPSA